MNDNFRALDAAGLLTRDGLVQLVRNSFTGSFLSEDEKAKHLEAVNEVLASF